MVVILKIGNKKIYSPIVHLYVYGKILDNSGYYGYIIEKKLIDEWIRRIIRIPKTDREIFLKEMCQIGLFKKLNRDTYEILRIKFDRTKIFNKKRVPTNNYGNPLW